MMISSVIDRVGRPIFVADWAELQGEVLRLRNALQYSEDHDLKSKVVVFCTDPVQAEVLKVLQAGSITMGSQILTNEPVARSLSEMLHNVSIKAGVLAIYWLDEDGQVKRNISPSLSQMGFSY